MSKHDLTMADTSAYGSKAWVAQRIGRSTGWLDRRRETLEAEGFPSVDPLVGLYLKADVETWIHRRRQKSDTVANHHATTEGINSESL